MTVREWIEENGIDAIVYDTHTDRYLFEYQNKEDGLWYEGDIVEEHEDFEMVLDYEILKIDYELNDKPTLEIYLNSEDIEEDGQPAPYSPEELEAMEGLTQQELCRLYGFWG